MSLLSLDRFNSSARKNLLKEMTAFFFDKEELIVEGIDLVPSDFYIDSKSYFTMKERQSTIKEYILRCYAFFVIDVRYRVADDAYYIMYQNKEFFIPQIIVHSYFFHQIYNDVENYKQVERDWQQRILRSIEMIPMRNVEKDGQMKIMIDAVLSVDAMLIEESQQEKSYKILIVGSSHDPTINPRYSYEPIEYMIKNSEIHMYDMIEESGMNKVNTNKIYRYRKAYDYQNLKDFDLVIDDSWVDGLPAIDNKYLRGIDIRDVMPDHYSIKSFRDYVDYNNYHQVVKTTSKEIRCVSRPIIPSYENHEYLGSCVYCRELKFFLQQKYSDQVYEKILALHKKFDCYPSEWYDKTKQDRYQYRLIRPVWIEVDQVEMDYRKIEKSIVISGYVVRRRIDDFYFPDLYGVELRAEHLRNVSIIISSDEYLTYVMLSAKHIFKWEKDKLYKMQKQQKETYQIHEESIDYVTERVKSLKYSEKARQERNREIRKQCDLDRNLKHTAEEIQSEYLHASIRESYEKQKDYSRQEKVKVYRKVMQPFEDI